MNSALDMKKEKYWLSIVIIGRNEEKRLPGLFASLPAHNGIEWIYVDSASEDLSVEIALKKKARVLIIDKDSIYAPATGRYAGTLEAEGHWILYLDGDMVLRKEFLRFLDDLKSASVLPDRTVGFVGRTINYYLDGSDQVVGERDYVVLSPKEMGAPEKWGKQARYHGGAVLYLREAVLKAGNWNPALYQLEELDLYSRIYAAGGIVRAVDLPMAEHHTPFLTCRERLWLNFLPQWRGKKLYGAGQLVSARIKEGGFFALVRFYPYPFLIFAGLLSVPLFVCCWPLLPLVVNIAIVILIGFKKKWYYYLVYLGNLLQIFYGICRYKPFTPRYKIAD